MKLKTVTAVLAVASLLGGCTTMSPIANRKGSRPNTADTGPLRIFALRADAAYQAAQAGTPDEDSRSRKMLEAGFDLVRLSCRDYFRAEGRDQTIINTGRDSAVAGFAFGTAAAGLNVRNQRWLRGVPVFSGGLFSGLDVYDKNVLFSAANIEAVQELVLKAVGTHQQAANDALGSAPLSYSHALDIIDDDQRYCMPPKIRELVAAAIKTGDLEVKSSGPAAGQLSVQDTGVLAAIGKELKLNTPLSLNDAVPFYWLYEYSPTPSDIATIKDQLKTIPEAAGAINAAGAIDTMWPHYAPIKSAPNGVEGLTSDSQLRIARAINAYKTQVATRNDAIAAVAKAGFDASSDQGKALKKIADSPPPPFPSVGGAAATNVVVDVKGSAPKAP